MASRCIKLTRIHAIQWFGYCDTFDIRGNLLIAGQTGAGKSILMDLIQLVLIGNRGSRFNAAAGDVERRVGRDLKSYCLCDTQDDGDGPAKFARDGGTTYVALEFTWPDGERVETWGMRITYANSEAPNPEEDFFMVEGRLNRSDFLTQDGFALPPAGLLALIKSHDGQRFSGVTSYRAEIADHLNFDRKTVDYLMPEAMSFVFMRSFDEFCRRHILETSQVKIEEVQRSYRNYLTIREDLKTLSDKASKLEEAVGTYDLISVTRRDVNAYRVLEAEFNRSAARSTFSDLIRRRDEITARNASLRKEFDEVEVRIESKNREIDTLKSAFRDSGGGLLLDLTNRIKEAVIKIDSLRAVGKTVEGEKNRRVSRLKDFAKEAADFLQSAGVSPTAAQELMQGISTLERATPETFRTAVRNVSAVVTRVQQGVRSAVTKESEQMQVLKKELAELQSQLKNLEVNKLGQSPLLDELNMRLPRKGRENPARQLRELCEVTDEEWRPAIELALTRKFAIVVSPEDYPEALRIYKEFSQDSLQESLIDPVKALSRTSRTLGNSLAEKISSDHPIARIVIDELFGSVVCVRSLEDLRLHNDAIMKDGFRQRGLFAERPRRYDQRPCIGAKGVQRLRQHLEVKAEECAEQILTLTPILLRSSQIQEDGSSLDLDTDAIEGAISEASRLSEYESLRDGLISQKTAASTPELDAQNSAIQVLVNEERELQNTRLSLNGRLQSREFEDVQSQLETAESRKARAERNYDEAVNHHAPTLDVSRCNTLRDDVSGNQPTDESRATHCQLMYRDGDAKIPGLEDKLFLLRRGLVERHPDLKAEPDFDPDTEWNASYTTLLERIRVDDMPGRQKQAEEEEHRWQHFFQTQVAAKLQDALRGVTKTITDINSQLKRPIGDSQYHIRVAPNSDNEFEKYRRVLEVCSVTQEGDSLFASLDAMDRELVEQVFKALVDAPDGKLAKDFLDYRSYFRYDMEVSNPKRPELPPKSINRHSHKFSGGEKQTPFYISILACYMRAYQRHKHQKYTEPSIGIVPIDEAFSKMSGDRITDATRALRDLDLQGIFSMSSGNWPYAITECDQILAVHQRETLTAGKKVIRNIAALLTRDEALERSKNWE